MAKVVDSLVRIVAGKLGGGKSAWTVRRMLDSLMAGEIVVSNIKLKRSGVEAYCAKRKVRVPWGNYRYVDSAEIDERPACLLEYLADGGCTLVIDEVHLWLSSRAWRENEKKAKDFQSFLTQARKLDVDVYLISQDERNIDSLLQRMATHIVRCTNWLHFPVLGKLLPLSLSVARICAPDGTTQIGREWFMRKGELYACYESKQRFREIELTGKKAGKVLGQRAKQMTWGMMCTGLGVVLLALDMAWNWKRKDKDKKAEVSQVAAPSPAPVKETPPAPVPVTKSAAAGSPQMLVGQAPPRPEKGLTRQERVKIESSLPSVFLMNPAYFALVGGERIFHGSFFLCGLVKGWRLEGGTLLVKIDSEDIPEIRLFYANRSRPYVYDMAGGINRRSSHGGSRDARSSVFEPAGVAGPPIGQPGGVVPAPVVPGPLAGSYVRPEPFIPQDSTYVSVTPSDVGTDGYRWPKAEVVPEALETVKR